MRDWQRRARSGVASAGGSPDTAAPAASSARLTKVPAPVRDSTSPSATSRSNTSTMVVRETPSSLARVRVAGSRSPARRAPARMMSRTPLAIWVASGRLDRGSILIDWSRAPPALFTMPGPSGNGRAPAEAG